jgi:hypothetical protein
MADRQVTVDFNIKDFIAAAERIEGARQVLPYVIANLLNDGAFKTRQVLVQDTWPTHVVARNRNFISASLQVEKANKNNLEVMIYDRLDHGNLKMHAEGGNRRARGNNLAIPDETNVRKGAGGVYKSQLPSSIISRTPKRALRITTRGIFVGRGGRLIRMYSLKPQVEIKADVPFYKDFNYVMLNAVRTGFADAVAFSLRRQAERNK